MHQCTKNWLGCNFGDLFGTMAIGITPFGKMTFGKTTFGKKTNNNVW
jgi:hypothetical protein